MLLRFSSINSQKNPLQLKPKIIIELLYILYIQVNHYLNEKKEEIAIYKSDTNNIKYLETNPFDQHLRFTLIEILNSFEMILPL